MRDETSRPGDDLVSRERRRKPPQANPREPSLVDQLDCSVACERCERDLLDPVVPLVPGAAPELDDSAFAHVDPVVVVKAATDSEMIPRLECGEVSLSCQVLKRATAGGD